MTGHGHDPAALWEERYVSHRGESGRMWSGRVNAAVEHEVAGLPAGTALELGSGEGGDALWLASHGWTVAAIDISANALAVAAEEAQLRGLSHRVTWLQADLAQWHPSAEFDLVTAAFLHSPVELPREEILRRAVAAVAPGGRLLIVGHGAPPPGMADGKHDHEVPPTADEVLTSLALPADWAVETNGIFERTMTWKGTRMTIADTVLRVRRPVG
ncbi:MAG: class I SAM-dependent methyltransferase [Salinibacterium sp.]|nr:class I SAM-dependent methyltransferase [Salinibacterium sp.]MBF0672443.1 class I SAM-dependent methyltransferase [Salinibacterium sp.]